ncbi:hypothetical protein [Paenibacillus sp. S150]|uniref:hypothetical protein n=1 Tax=Paenibacillus sp. S150 TaxID=2749826 RepID=UPI001C58668C|nr:hypothetical protein [Paenibacillus sp. S150]MBW4083052.1 hypothetical protein [Paenibacillus sp. S150]
MGQLFAFKELHGNLLTARYIQPPAEFMADFSEQRALLLSVSDEQPAARLIVRAHRCRGHMEIKPGCLPVLPP